MVLETDFNGSARLVQKTLSREGKPKWLLLLHQGAYGECLFTGREEEGVGYVSIYLPSDSDGLELYLPYLPNQRAQPRTSICMARRRMTGRS